MTNLRARFVGVAVVGTLLASAAAAATTGEALAVPSDAVQLPETKPSYRLADALKVTVNIPVTDAKGKAVDTDRDGQPDRVQLRLLRPSTPAGVKVPTIIEPSPYNGAKGQNLSHHLVDMEGDATPLMKEYIRQRIAELRARSKGNVTGTPEEPTFEVREDEVAKSGWDMTREDYFDNYFVPRGYAVADLDALGTGQSSGCPGMGNDNEAAGVKAAVDWLNGRVKGYDENNQEVNSTSWSSGNVGIKGKSYNGTLAIEAAGTGVEGLKTIVSVAGISDWYGYTRSNGAVRSPLGVTTWDLDSLAASINTGKSSKECRPVIVSEITANLARNTGDRTKFWDDRNHVDGAKKTKASVFLIQGTKDEIVRPSQAIPYWDALQRAGVPSKLWVTQADHLRPFSMRPVEYMRQMHRWYDHWLYGMQNGIMEEPKVDVQQDDISTWTTQSAWPAPTTKNVTLNLHADGSLSSTRDLRQIENQSMKDLGASTEIAKLIDKNGVSTPNSLAYVTAPLTEDVTIEGTPSFSIKASLDGTSPNLTALLVDYGPQRRSYYYPEAYLPGKLCYSQKLESIAGNTGCNWQHYASYYKNFDHKIITQGWTDIRNRTSDRHQTPTHTIPLKFNWDAEPTHFTVPKGNRIGVVILSTDKASSLRYGDGTTLTAQTELSSVTIPVRDGNTDVFNN